LEEVMSDAKLLNPEKLEDLFRALRRYDLPAWVGRFAAQIAAHIAALETRSAHDQTALKALGQVREREIGERDAALADNAALVSELARIGGWAAKARQSDLEVATRALLSEPHPGAALLEAHAKALSDVEHLRRQRAHMATLLGVADAGAYQNDWEAPVRRALVRVRNEGLEKAAHAFDENDMAATAAEIRALKEAE
jgi:hypothetical protein